MNPGLNFEECNFEQLFGVIDKQTQTSNTHILETRSSIPFVTTTHEAQDSDKGSIKLFEFTQFVQENESPESVKIIRESLTEEIHIHEDNILSDDGTSNRYRYCREVIKPHLKAYPGAQETLVKEALDAANEEYPDCIERNAAPRDVNSKEELKISSGLNKIKASEDSSNSAKDKTLKTKDSCRSTICKVDALCSPMESKGVIEQKRSKTDIEDKKSRACTEEKKPKCTKKESKVEKKESGTKLKCPVPKDPCKNDEKKSGTVIITKRPSTRSADIDRSCTSKKDSAIGIVPSLNPEEKPSFYQSKSPVESNTIINPETISTIKTAVEGFFTKVYKTTHDAVTSITSESAKQLERMRKTDSSNTTTSQRKTEEREDNGVTSFNFFSKLEGLQKDSKAESSESSVESLPREVIGKIVDKVDSALSMISDTFNESVPDIFKFKSYNDTSSAYDEPKPPKRVTHVVTTPQELPPNNMFMAIKSRICSMFCEGEGREIVSLNQSSRASTESSSSSSLSASEDEVIEHPGDKVSE